MTGKKSTGARKRRPPTELRVTPESEKWLKERAESPEGQKLLDELAMVFFEAAVGRLIKEHFDMTHMKSDAALVLEHQQKLAPQLRSRGVRLLPGGDYGFPFNPNGRNARDLELFVRHLGYTATEALVAATKLGGQLMGMGSELGQIKPGYLADLLLIDGDPIENIAVLQDRSKLRAIMKDGKFHKAPVGAHA
jgi:imidazolonepropionase-like amidohydrolase